MGMRVRELDDLWPVIDGLAISRADKSFVYGHMWDLYHAEEDRKTFRHSVNLASMVSSVASKLGLNRDDLVLGGLLHDIGKMRIPREVFLKPGKYTESDRMEMRNHPEHSYEMLKNRFPKIAEFVRYHHGHQGERSYPENLSDTPGMVGKRDFYYSKILATHDDMEARTSPDRANDGWEKHDGVAVPMRNKRIVNVRGIGVSSNPLLYEKRLVAPDNFLIAA